MNNEPEPGKDPKSSDFIFIWLVIGLLPIPILLSALSPNGGRPSWMGPWVLIVCGLMNLVGGIGCMSGLKDPAGRVALGFLLGCFFFALSWGLALFQACSHMNI